jgi:hypothetical protein
MSIIIWITVTAILGAFALYWYGRGNIDLQYEMEENAPSIIACVVFWPVTIPLAAVGFVLYKIGSFFYNLGERHKDEKDS